LEFTRQYLARGCQVFAASRKAEDSPDLQQLGAQYGNRLAVYPLDVTDAGSRRHLYRALSARTKKLDLLINSAGVISGNEKVCYPFGELRQDDLSKTFLVNSIAPLMMVEGALPFLIQGAPSIVANLSSDNGSISKKNRQGKYGYSASKAALNMMTRILSIELRDQGIIVVSLHPGWVQTTMTRNENAPLAPAESISGLIQVIESLDMQDSGRFLDWKGRELPW
jgi:NAD(P)-dependent dehydrogenase (short-subunit alcohol dehydrogenase family)